MSPATSPRSRRVQRLLHLDLPSGEARDRPFGDFPSLLHRHDLLVLNDAATLPASLRGKTASNGPVELRLVERESDAVAGEELWQAVLFGAGDHRTRTEDRPPPPSLGVGDDIFLGSPSEGELRARIVTIDPRSPRLVRAAFDARGAAFWSAIYRIGRPVQYAYIDRPLDLWDVQNGYAARPWAVELPSAGRPLDFALLADLARRGVEVATLTHAAGLSSTGDAVLDALLPLPERYEIPESTVRAIARAQAEGGRIIAVGTTVARALEGAALEQGIQPGAADALAAGEGRTALRIDATLRPRVVDGILSGVHEATESHYGLLAAFAPEARLASALRVAEASGYLVHEFGDSLLILPRSPCSVH